MILVISPHGDDAELGMGATMARRACSERVRHVVMTTSPYQASGGDLVSQQQRMDEAALASRELGVELHPGPFIDNKLTEDLPGMVSYLDSLFGTFQPTDVYTCLPWFNADHDAVYRATLAAMRKIRPTTFWAYEMPMQHLGCMLPEHGWVYSKVEREHVNRKVSALTTYGSQNLLDKPGPISVAGALKLMELRGLECGCDWAERQLLLRGVGL